MDKFPWGVNETSNGFTKHMARRKPFLLNTNKKIKSPGILQNQENDNFICQKQ